MNGDQTVETPLEFFNWTEKFLGIKFFTDLAATVENKKCGHFISEEENSLCKDWSEEMSWCWLNPPFKNTQPWIEKCIEQRDKGARICMITPIKTSERDSGIYKYANRVIQLQGRIWPEVRDCQLSVWNSRLGQWPIEVVNWKTGEKLR